MILVLEYWIIWTWWHGKQVKYKKKYQPLIPALKFLQGFKIFSNQCELFNIQKLKLKVLSILSVLWKQPSTVSTNHQWVRPSDQTNTYFKNWTKPEIKWPRNIIALNLPESEFDSLSGEESTPDDAFSGNSTVIVQDILRFTRNDFRELGECPTVAMSQCW